MPVRGDRSVAICQQCGTALAVRIQADGSIRPIGTGTACSCGGESFDVIGDRPSETADSDAAAEETAESDDESAYPRP
ncbi:hypothetical protein [Haloterrigena salifodinae]|uniref:Uncharacterized protein n=1 Tax=Haloterrigena salifodinae TaxID=2675099 RepID=A0A8T8DZE9_9EURY|nr:hypothetical protein [Haloterrigena salifodinae]QRV14712.1 hypothetical protein JMJ58_17570 [Haloterrigena salifodinae]